MRYIDKFQNNIYKVWFPAYRLWGEETNQIFPFLISLVKA